MIQLQMLNFLLETKDYSILAKNGINESYFSDYEKEYKFIVDHFSKYSVVPDKETFLNVFPNFDVLVVNESPDYLVRELAREKNSRFLSAVFNGVRELLIQDKVDEAMGLFMNSTEQISETASFKPIDLMEDTSRFKDYLERSSDHSKFYVSTGFKELDDILGGWDRQEDLVTIVARNGVGKSWILLKTALEAVKEGLNVGLYSGEMSAKMVGYRADTLISNLSNTKLIHGNLDVQFEYKEFLDDLKNKMKGHLKILTPEMVDGRVGVSALRMFVEKEHLDMLCVDQHSLLDDDREAKNPVDKASNISKDLKLLQATKRIPIIAVSQQNRTSSEDGVSTAMISQSDRIGQDSTIVIFLEKTKGDEKAIIMTLVKSRFSSSGKKIPYKVDFDKGVFEYDPNMLVSKKKRKNDNPVEVEENTNIVLNSNDDISFGEDIF